VGVEYIRALNLKGRSGIEIGNEGKENHTVRRRPKRCLLRRLNSK
jgi:hypothetical protein